MTKLFSVDASVFIAACRRHEAEHAASCEFLRLARQEGSVLIEPAILPVEIAAALARGREGAARAVEYAHGVLALPTLNLHALDGTSVLQAMRTAVQCRLRGADALYVAAAMQYRARLVTLDAEQLERAPASVHACKPDVAVRLLKTTRKETSE